METFRQQPFFKLDHEARKQIRETRTTILDHLDASPDDLKGLVLADVLGEIDPDRDPGLAAHRIRFRATRTADWKLRAKALGLDRLLYNLARGMTEARIGRDAVPVLERYATDLAETRAPATVPGHIDASYVPDTLVSDPRVTIAYHPSGHLARVVILIDASSPERDNGELALDERPGSGHYAIVEKRGGYGTMIREDYRDGGVVTTLNTPWHDGEESISKKPWTRWVEENLADLARLAAKAKPAKRKRK